MEDAHRRAGHEGILFIRRPDRFMSRGPIGSGINLCKISGAVYSITGVGLSAAIRAGPSLKKIMRGEPIIIDIPVVYCGYHGDQTRSYVIGKASSGIHSLYYGLKDISDYVISNLADGVSCSEIYQLAWQRARELGLEAYFQSVGGGKRSNFVGHGVGLELNELPMLTANDYSTLHSGHTVALDMHMMHPEWGVVKLEDIVLITTKWVEILTISPRELFEVEP